MKQNNMEEVSRPISVDWLLPQKGKTKKGEEKNESEENI